MREVDLLYDELTGELLRLCLPGEVRRLGTWISGEEAHEMQQAKPATPTTLLKPAYTLIGVSGQSDVSEINGLVWTKDGQPHIDKDGILRIHVVTSTGCA